MYDMTINWKGHIWHWYIILGVSVGGLVLIFLSYPYPSLNQTAETAIAIQ